MLRLKTTSPCRMRKKLQRRNRPTEQFVEGILTHRNLQGGHGFCCLQLSSFRRWGTEGFGKKSEKMQSKRRSTLTVWFFVQAASWLHQSLQTMPYHSFLKIVETPFSTPKCTWKMFAYLAFLLCPSIPSWWFQSPLEAATVVSSFPSSGRCWRRIKEGEVEERTIRDKGDQEGGLDSSWFKNIDLCGCFRK